MKTAIRAFAIMLAFAVLFPTAAPAQNLAEGYCIVRHPLEAVLVSQRSTCEQQHIIQQQRGGADDGNVVWINTTEHHYSDRSRSRPWEKSRPWIPGFLYGDNLEQAYMLGTYANGYHFVISGYNRGSSLTLFAWDGVSHTTYLVAGWANLVTKELSYMGYLIRRLYTEGETFADIVRIMDGLVGIAIDIVEMSVGTIYGVLGIVIGSIVNPLDTLSNIPGGALLIAESVLTAIWNTLANFLSLFTLGYIDVSK